MNKSSSKEEMLWYINQTHRNRWSRSTVLRQFELQAYQRNMIEPITTKETSMDDIVKDTLYFGFISKKDVKSEKDLKNKLVENIILFLQELGQGFSLVGKEYKLTTPSNRHFYIDLLMYHIKSHAYVVIEVKLGEIAPSDLGQLNFYVNAVDDLEKGEDQEIERVYVNAEYAEDLGEGTYAGAYTGSGEGVKVKMGGEE